MADAVERDAQEADQEAAMPSELELKTDVQFRGPKYLAYLNNKASHHDLQMDISMHLWKLGRLRLALKKVNNYRHLLDFQDKSVDS